MPGAGLEPAWKIRQILSLLRLPFRHPGAIFYKCSIARAKVKSIPLKKIILNPEMLNFRLETNGFRHNSAFSTVMSAHRPPDARKTGKSGQAGLKNADIRDILTENNIPNIPYPASRFVLPGTQQRFRHCISPSFSSCCSSYPAYSVRRWTPRREN